MVINVVPFAEMSGLILPSSAGPNPLNEAIVRPSALVAPTMMGFFGTESPGMESKPSSPPSFSWSSDEFELSYEWK